MPYFYREITGRHALALITRPLGRFIRVKLVLLNNILYPLNSGNIRITKIRYGRNIHIHSSFPILNEKQ